MFGQNINKDLLEFYLKDVSELNNFMSLYGKSDEDLRRLRRKLKRLLHKRLNEKYHKIAEILDRNNVSPEEKNKLILDHIHLTDPEKISKTIFAVAPKAKEYCDLLQKQIKDSVFDIKDEYMQKLLIPLYSNSFSDNKELKKFYENIAFVVLSIVCKAFNSINSDKYDIPQTTLKKLIGAYFIETYRIIQRQAEFRQQIIEQDSDSVEFEKDISQIQKEINLENLSSKENEQTLIGLGLYLIQCILHTKIQNSNELGSILESYTVTEGSGADARTYVYFRLTGLGKELLGVLPTYGYNLPLLTQNLFFKETKKKTFYTTRHFTFSMYRYGDFTGTREAQTTIGGLIYKALNTLQRNEYKINKKQLNNIKLHLLEYFIVMSEFQICALKYNSAADYINAHNRYSSLAIKSALRVEYDKSKAFLLKFLDTICVAELYKDTVFYFNHFVDFRGRMYCDAYPLNTQGDFISRSLILLNEYDSIQGHDVSGSGFQIIGLLTGCNKLLELTNYKKRKIYSKEEYPDIYTYIGINFIKFLENYVANPKTKSKVKDKVVDYKKFANLILFDRDLIKKLSMCYIYGEGRKARAKKIRDRKLFLSFEIICDDTCTALGNRFKEFIESDFDNLKEFTTFLKRLLTDVHEDVYENEDEDEDENEDKTQKKKKGKTQKASEPVDNSITDQKSKNDKLQMMVLTANPIHITTVLSYLKTTTTRASFYNPFTRTKEKLTLSITQHPSEIDFKKVQRAIMPNFIHMLDSIIAAYIISDSHYYKDVAVYSVHDSFYTSPENADFINFLYHYAIKKTFVENNPIAELLDANLKSIPKEKLPKLIAQTVGFHKNSLAALSEMCELVDKVSPGNRMKAEQLKPFNHTLKIENIDPSDHVLKII